MTAAAKSTLRSALLFGALVGFGCNDGGGGGGESGPTYWTDVAPIYYGKCVRCHQQGGIAPFRLDSYEDAKNHAADAASMTAADLMPPFYISHDGTCGSFEDGEALTAAEKKTIADWAKGSRPAGTTRTLQLPALPALESGTDFRTPTFAPVPEGGMLAEFDEYRCFGMDAGVAADSFITGYEVRPGNAGLVHHVLLFVADPEAMGAGGRRNAEILQALDDASADRAGWPCFGAAGEGVNVDAVPVDWAPGQGVVSYPSGMGVAVKRTSKLIIQVHYNLADPALRGQTDTSTVKLRFASSVNRRLVFALPDPFLDTLSKPMPDTIPPGQTAASYSWTMTGTQLGLADLPYVDLVAVMPHMHQRGRQLELQIGEVGAAGGGACAAKTTRWDFHWQRMYSYRSGAAPRLTAASQLGVTCQYDTSADTTPILPGWGTRNEMCLTVLMVALPPGI
jgi:hypothetical protein